MSQSCERIPALVTTIQNDFLDVPGLTLTPAQAQKRFGADKTTCDAVLSVLADAGVLVRTSDGAYARRVPRPSSRHRFAA